MSFLPDWLKVTLRAPDRHAPVFEVVKGATGWYWHERASNGQISGGNGQGTASYASKFNARRAAFAHAARVDGATVKVIG